MQISKGVIFAFFYLLLKKATGVAETSEIILFSQFQPFKFILPKKINMPGYTPNIFIISLETRVTVRTVSIFNYSIISLVKFYYFAILYVVLVMQVKLLLVLYCCQFGCLFVRVNAHLHLLLRHHHLLRIDPCTGGSSAVHL